MVKTTDLTHGDFGSRLAGEAGLEDLSGKYQAFLDSIIATDTVPARVLTLCFQRIRQIHGLASTQLTASEQQALAHQDMGSFNEDEQVALVAAEKIPYQHHDLSDEEVAQIRATFGDKGCVNLLTALSFFDVSCRLDLTFSQAFNQT